MPDNLDIFCCLITQLNINLVYSRSKLQPAWSANTKPCNCIDYVPLSWLQCSGQHTEGTLLCTAMHYNLCSETGPKFKIYCEYGRVTTNVSAIVQLLELDVSALGFPLHFFGRLVVLRSLTTSCSAFSRCGSSNSCGSSEGTEACQLVTA